MSDVTHRGFQHIFPHVVVVDENIYDNSIQVKKIVSNTRTRYHKTFTE